MGSFEGRMHFEPKGNKEAAIETERVIREQEDIIGLYEWNKKVSEEEHGIDSLTGVNTRSAFEAKLRHAFEIMNRKEEHRHGPKAITEISLIFIDLDNFKKVNDTLGHSRGDDVLKRASLLLSGVLRENDVLGRFGGDEFVVLLPNTDKENATIVAEKLRSSLENDSELQELTVTGSFGVVSARALEYPSPENLIQTADQAVYGAKRKGRNTVHVYEEVVT